MVNMDIITGFLGAGKTTLINKLLAEDYIGEKPVLIENEFGEASIDESLIENKKVQVQLLSSGCICCTLKGDFVDGIRKIMEQYNPSHIIIEPTGLADPSDILSACKEAGKSVPVRINAFISIANAKNFMRILDLGIELFRKQISSANFLVLNRTALLNPNEVTKTMNAIRRLNPNCIIVDQDRQHMDTVSILTLAEDAAKPYPDCGNHNCENNHHHDHGHGVEGFENISSLTFFPKRSFETKEMAGLFTAFSEGRIGQILRAKGFLKKAKGGYAYLEYVYGRGDLLDIDYTGLPKLIVIGIGLDKTSLTSLLGDI